MSLFVQLMKREIWILQTCAAFWSKPKQCIVCKLFTVSFYLMQIVASDRCLLVKGSPFRTGSHQLNSSRPTSPLLQRCSRFVHTLTDLAWLIKRITFRKRSSYQIHCLLFQKVYITVLLDTCMHAASSFNSSRYKSVSELKAVAWTDGVHL